LNSIVFYIVIFYSFYFLSDKEQK